MVLKLSDPLLQLRAITANDEENLYQIYSSTRSEELAQLTNWTSLQKEVFLKSQFTAQHNYYQNSYKGAHFFGLLNMIVKLSAGCTSTLITKGPVSVLLI